ncbi:hypothetical protein DFR29_10643 [Tahibacter aquaticus]|uniref:Uncharacterized protein n=2 Tax=Tahibacter aquaticus TaxID=520092 RepID=A0A4R6YY24_9GAMM|nr:hypothetical protein DFR29_10643 [Tahibacter aquaticus]
MGWWRIGQAFRALGLLGMWTIAALGGSPSARALDFTPHGTQPLLQTPLEESSNCQGCHRGTSAPHNSLMPFSSWAGSMMANATRDPLFWAALDVANKDFPGAGDYCLRCHTPSGWLAGRVAKKGDGSSQPANGASGCQLNGDYNDSDGYQMDYGGVGCHYCHRMMPHGPQGPQAQPFAIGNGNTWIDDAGTCITPSGDQYGGPCRRGPYAYVNYKLEPPHGWQQSPLHASSDLCGTCHDVSTPDTDAGPLKTLVLENGTATTRPFPIERTYTEWKRSLFADLIFRDGIQAPSGTPVLTKAQQCQGCHMPNTDDPLAQACNLNPEGSRTGNMPVHTFVGANTWVPAMIKSLYGGSGGLNRSGDFDRTIAWARALLQSSAKVTTTLTAFTPPGPSSPGQIGVRVRTTNLSGHKLPTGYAEGRRMWLNVKVFTPSNVLVAESGAFDAASGVLGEDSQIKIYEALQGIWDATPPGVCRTESGGVKKFHFVLNNCVAKDNRIPPLGFRPAAAGDANGDEVRPVGYSYAETAPGSGELVNYDDTAYTFVLPAGTALPVRIEANLQHQISSKEYIEFLRNQAQAAPAVPAENVLCSGAPGRPFNVGPQNQSRGEFMYSLWANPAYGKSPPETAATATLMAGN